MFEDLIWKVIIEKKNGVKNVGLYPFIKPGAFSHMETFWTPFDFKGRYNKDVVYII